MGQASLLIIALRLTQATRSYNGNLDLTYPYIEVPFILKNLAADGGEILVDKNHNNTEIENPYAVHACADGRIKLTRRHVGDGICDCCDGSDELPQNCPNTCVQWEREIANRNELITSTMRKLQNVRSERFDRGIALRDITTITTKASELTDQPGESEMVYEGEELSEETADEPTKKSLSEYAKWMLPAKERVGDTIRTNWFMRIWTKLTSRTNSNESLTKSSDGLVLAENLRSSVLSQHPEWLYTAASRDGSRLTFMCGEKTYTLENFLSITMRESWQHLQPTFGRLTSVEIIESDFAERPTKYGDLISPVIFRFSEGGSQCKDRYYSDEKNDWVVRNDQNYSATLFTVCGDSDQLIHVEFQKPCVLYGVIESPAACVSKRQAHVESLPSGPGKKRVEL